jgi:hypothetical protein
MVGLIPLSAVHVIASAMVGGLRRFIDRAQLLLEQRPSLLKNVAPIGILGRNESVLLSIVNTDRLKAVLHRMLDRDEFLSDYGIRALSRYHLRHPCVLSAGGQTVTVKYLPGESDSRSFGGNSNWRGADLVSSELSVSERAA